MNFTPVVMIMGIIVWEKKLNINMRTAWYVIDVGIKYHSLYLVMNILLVLSIMRTVKYLEVFLRKSLIWAYFMTVRILM